jgi:hypothetical protein
VPYRCLVTDARPALTMVLGVPAFSIQNLVERGMPHGLCAT